MTATVYRFFDVDGKLLYVGVTTVGPTRWTQHAVNQSWWPWVASVKVEHFTTVEAALESELAAIRLEAPLFNVIHAAQPKVRTARSRPRGTGSVYRNQRGQWVAQISLGRNGYGRRPLRSFASRDEAERGLVEMLRAPLESWGPSRRV